MEITSNWLNHTQVIKNKMRGGFLSLLVFICCATKVSALTVSSQDANAIGEKIWRNECKGTIEGLTNWKKGENFASMGIGHFIWYPAEKKERFRETFPE